MTAHDLKVDTAGRKRRAGLETAEEVSYIPRWQDEIDGKRTIRAAHVYIVIKVSVE